MNSSYLVTFKYIEETDKLSSPADFRLFELPSPVTPVLMSFLFPVSRLPFLVLYIHDTYDQCLEDRTKIRTRTWYQVQNTRQKIGLVQVRSTMKQKLGGFYELRVQVKSKIPSTAYDYVSIKRVKVINLGQSKSVIITSTHFITIYRC